MLTGSNAVTEQKSDEQSDMKALIESVKRIELLLEKALEGK
ncbi:hypothetical protein [Alteromonas gracilis]